MHPLLPISQCTHDLTSSTSLSLHASLSLLMLCSNNLPSMIGSSSTTLDSTPLSLMIL
jgi:hypothetical protein